MAKKQKPGPSTQGFFENGGGKIKDYSYGVLRASFRGVPNTTDGFVARKLLIGGADNSMLAWRSDVVVPLGVDDGLTRQLELWRSYEAARLPAQRDLALVLTVWLEPSVTLADGWEAVRDWARSSFAMQRRLPATVVQHHPGAAGHRTAPHCHVVVAARELSRLGWGPFSDLCRDGPLYALHGEWDSVRRRHGLV